MLISLNKGGVNLGKDFLEDFSNRLSAYFRIRETELFEYTTLYVLKNTLKDWGFETLSDAFLEKSIAEMYAVTQAHWIPEEDAMTTIALLHARGYRMGLVSNGADDANTQSLVDKLGARRYFEVVLSSAAIGMRKPNPQIFNIALQAMHLPANRAVLVGDTLGADILGAQHAGIFSIWITRRADTPGNRALRETIHPNATITALIELPILLNQL